MIAAEKVVPAGHSSVLAAMAGLRLPVESHALQALVSEPINRSCTVVMSNAVHVYVSQSDKGEMVIGHRRLQLLLPAGQLPDHRRTDGRAVGTVPDLFAAAHAAPVGRHRRCLPDASPIISKTPVEGLYINCGWGPGGFKATPGSGWVFAHTIAQDRPHKLNEAFTLERFATGALIDEHGAAAVAH